MSKNVLIINAHSFENKGDAAIIISMISSIKEFNVDSKVTVLSREYKKDQIYLKYGADKVGPSIINTYQDISFLKKILLFQKELIRVLLKNGDKFDIAQEYKKSDIVVSCGGAFLYSKTKSKVELTIINHFLQIAYALSLGKKVVIYSQSIGPFKNPVVRHIAKKILKKVDMIFVREEISSKILNSLGLSNFKLSADSAFSLEKETFQLENIINDEEKYIAITVRQWDFPGHDNRAVLYRNYISNIAKLIDYIIDKYNYEIIFIPQVIGPNKHEDDRVAFNDLIKEIKRKEKVNLKLLSYDLTPGQIKYIYTKCRALIGTRMHSNIFALSESIPVIAISYEHKTNGIMEMLNMSNFTVNINEFTFEDVKRIFQNLDLNYEAIVRELQESSKRMREMSKIPAKWISDMLK